MAGPPLQPQDPGGSEVEAETQRWCAEEPCRRRPFFGNVGGKPMYCSQHSKTREGMVDVSSRRCEAVGCAKWPLYGNEGEKAKFCSLHKSAAMIDVRSRRCAAADCKRQPSYGFEGKRACFCAAHKAQGMVDVVSRRCEHPNCRRRPLYGYEGQKSQFCSAHKQEGQVDVCNRRCQQPGCSKRPCFGRPGQRPSFCGTHRSPDMVDVISHKCAYPGCSHPTGHEGNRTRSKFCDKHKSVGLAGASLLQLATAAAGDAALTASTGQSAANLLPPPPPEEEEETAGAGGNGSPRAGGSRESGREQPGLSEPMYPAVAETPSRRASFHAPAATDMEALASDRRSEPRRRSSMPTPLLPSVQSLLEDIPHSRLKRHREEGGGGGRSYDMDASSPSPLLAPPAPAQESVRSAANGIRGGNGAERRSAADIGNGDGREGGGSSSGGSGVAAMETESQGPTAVPDASAHSRPATKASRVGVGSSAGSGQQDSGWASRKMVWNSPNSTGYVTASPAMDFRRSLASLGRAASFDEMRAAENRNGLKSEDASQSRRASAFMARASALPPKLTEIARRDSAFVARGRPAARRTAHYSDLLAASAPSRSFTEFNGRPGYSPSVALLNSDARIEEEVGGDDDMAAGGRADAPPPTSGSRPVFHVMPATATFNTGLPPRSPTEMPSTGQGRPGDRRYSFLDQGSSSSRPAAAENDGAGATFAPAWGAPAEEGDGDGIGGAAVTQTSEADNPQAAGTMAGAGDGDVAGTAAGNQPPRRPPRRGSMVPPAPAAGRLGAPPRHWSVAGSSSDHDRGTSAEKAFAPAWGAASEEKPAEERAGPSAAEGRGTGRRVKALFGGGGGAGDARSRGGTETGSGTDGVLISQRSGLPGPGMSAAHEGPRGSSASGPRRWSMSERSTPAPDQRRPSTAAFVRPLWGEATEDGAAEGPSSTSSFSPVRQAIGNGPVVNSRRGSMAPGAMLPPAPRRGSVVAHGPLVSTSSQRRGSVVMGALEPSGEEGSGGR